MSTHKIVHIEISSQDAEAMKAFYGGVFGWTFSDFPDMNYTTFETEKGALGGGFNPINAENPAGTILVYIDTDDLADSVAKVKAAGGNIVLEHQDIPGVGAMAVFVDPSGNAMSLLQPLPME